MSSLKEIEIEHNLLLDSLTDRIKVNIRRLGGMSKTSRKSGISGCMFSYYVRTDNFKTKIRTLKILEGLE